jgi:chemotaxis protein methyltransferase CheR
LPRLELRWPGYRKVRRQVCKRVKQRLRDLELHDYAAYRTRLETDASEWRILDACCHITISRFFRDRGTFEAIRRRVLPDVAARAQHEGRDARIWSAGCASGEEPYTLKMIWQLEVVPAYPSVAVRIIASDIDRIMLERAREGRFAPSSLRELPPPWIVSAFDQVGSRHCIKSEYREGIEFLEQDLRAEMPAGPFDLILCRYLAFTYFAVPLQDKMLAGMLQRLRPRGYLVIGPHEKLPAHGLATPTCTPQIFQKPAAFQRCAPGRGSPKRDRTP